MSEEELLAFVQPDETARELLARIACDPIQTGVFFLGCLRIGQVLEVTGQSGTAKTEVLIQVAAQCILPTGAAGRAEHVVFLDLDAKFDPLRLIQVLTARLQHAQASLDSSGAELRNSLKRFHLVQCRSSFDFLASLKTLAPLIERLQAQEGMQVVLIDNMAAHFWVDKARRAAAPGSPAAGVGCAAWTLYAVHAAASAHLQQMLRTLRCAAVATVHAILASHAGPGAAASAKGGSYGHNQPEQLSVLDPKDPQWQPRIFLPAPWQELVTHRVVVRQLTSIQMGGRSKFAAKWHQPAHDQIYTFHVTEAGIEQA